MGTSLSLFNIKWSERVSLALRTKMHGADVFLIKIKYVFSYLDGSGKAGFWRNAAKYLISYNCKLEEVVTMQSDCPKVVPDELMLRLVPASS